MERSANVNLKLANITSMAQPFIIDGSLLSFIATRLHLAFPSSQSLAAPQSSIQSSSVPD